MISAEILDRANALSTKTKWKKKFMIHWINLSNSCEYIIIVQELLCLPFLLKSCLIYLECW